MGGILDYAAEAKLDEHGDAPGSGAPNQNQPARLYPVRGRGPTP